MLSNSFFLAWISLTQPAITNVPYATLSTVIILAEMTLRYHHVRKVVGVRPHLLH